MGAGTDPAEGAALGRAILDELDSIGCRAIVTTHIGDLKTYAFTNPRAENAAVEFDVETLRPLYRLHIGDIGQSNALQIARRLDLPEHLVDRAARYLEQGRGEHAPRVGGRPEAPQGGRGGPRRRPSPRRPRPSGPARRSTSGWPTSRRQAENDARIAEARARLQPGDRVVVPRFGYDRPGRVVKLDPARRPGRRRHRPDEVGRPDRRADPAVDQRGRRADRPAGQAVARPSPAKPRPVR